MSEEGTKIVGEEEGSSLSPQAHAEAVAEKARAKGWRPLEEWEGDADDWVDAKEFVGRQKLYDRISDLKSTLTKVQRESQADLKAVAASLSKIRETEYKKALAELQAQRDRAVEDDDARAAVQATEAIKKLEVEKEKETQAQTQVSAVATPAFIEWQKANPWFDSDPEMRSDALHIGTGYLAGNPDKTQAEVLEYVTTKVKRMYPEKFETKEKKKVVAQVEGNSPSARQTELNTRKGKLTFDDLPPEYKKIAGVLIKSGALKSAAEKNKRSQEEEYLAQYAGALTVRNAGKEVE